MLRRHASIRVATPAILDELETLLASEGLKQVESRRAELRRIAPDAFQRLRTSALSGLPLTTFERVRGRNGRMEVAVVPIGQIEGAALVASDLRNAVATLLTALETIEASNDAELETLATPEVARRVAAGEYAAREVERSRDDLAGAERFFSLANRRRIARWSIPHQQRFRFQPMADGGLSIAVAGSEEQFVERLAGLKLPRLIMLRNLGTAGEP